MTKQPSRNTCSYGDCDRKVCNGDHFCTPCRDAQDVRDTAKTEFHLKLAQDARLPLHLRSDILYSQSTKEHGQCGKP
jgi:hypothetical protein